MRWTALVRRLAYLLGRRKAPRGGKFSAGRASVDKAVHSTTRVVPRARRD